ncbi:MAG TPA: alcohol dehydrogenase catalytic domain-containing protein, partial [Enteractinococcus helveticum]
MNIAGAVLRNSPSPSPYTDTQPLVVENLKLEEPGPTELLVKIEAAGLCHSDLSVVNGDRPRPVPMLLGHEASGIVESVGDAVTDVFTGDRVVLTFLPRCGECEACQTDGKLPCERGTTANENGTLLSGTDRLRDNSGNQVFHHLGCSAFATKAVVDRRSVVPVDQDVPPTVAALLGCAVLTGGGAVLNAGKPNPQDDIIV